MKCAARCLDNNACTNFVWGLNGACDLHNKIGIQMQNSISNSGTNCGVVSVMQIKFKAELATIK